MDAIGSDGGAVLVSAASKHGATAEIAERIGAVLRERGIAADVLDPGDVREVSRYDVFVIGSAVYAGHWMEGAKSLANRVGTECTGADVWLFSSGPIGDPPKPEEDPVDVADILAATSARDHRLLAGKIDKAKLSFPERAILVAVRATEGDFRDWHEIDTWANSIADAVTPTRTAVAPAAST
jgi:menaquinone-dependent protoporphyrinogen oxidase